MKPLAVRIRSLAVSVPERVIDNGHFRRKFPDQVSRVEESVLTKLWRPSPDGERHLFDVAMTPHLKDPFRGVVERRWLADGQRTVELEEDAARRALAAAGLCLGDVDAIFDAAFFPDQVDVGNAPFLAQRLGFSGPCVNLESACSGGLVGLINAAGLIAAGMYQRVLVVTSCNYSRLNREADTLGWGNGDAAAAVVVEAAAGNGVGVLGASIQSTHQTCGAVTSTMEVEDGVATIRMKTTKAASTALRDASEQMLDRCTSAALQQAGLSLGDVDVVAANCPTAWYADFIAAQLGVPRAKVVNIHPKLANVGPVLFVAALDDAVASGQVPAGALVLLYTVGSVSNAAACVLRQDAPIARG